MFASFAANTLVGGIALAVAAQVLAQILGLEASHLGKAMVLYVVIASSVTAAFRLHVPHDEFDIASDAETENKNEAETSEGFQEAKAPAATERPQRDEAIRDEAHPAELAPVKELGHDAASRSHAIVAPTAPAGEPQVSLETLFWGWVEASAAAVADWLDEVNAYWIEAAA